MSWGEPHLQAPVAVDRRKRFRTKPNRRMRRRSVWCARRLGLPTSSRDSSMGVTDALVPGQLVEGGEERGGV
jgi:hypothetical protein